MNAERDIDRLLVFAALAIAVAGLLVDRAKAINRDATTRLSDAVNHADAMEARVVELSDTVEARDAELDALTEAAEQATAAELARRKAEQ